jgi:hypothetical protein
LLKQKRLSPKPGTPSKNPVPVKARFLITYRIEANRYTITLPGVSAAHVWRAWDRPGSTLLDVRECDSNGLPL